MTTDNTKSNTSRLVRVRFVGQSNPCNFLIGNLAIEYGQKVVAMSDRGLAIGYVNSYPFDLPNSLDLKNILTINKIATDEDVVIFRNAYQDQRNARNIFNQLVSEHEMTMTLADVEFTSFGEQIIFYYTSPTRVDFRELLKSLSKRFKARIELRQIPSGERGSPSTTIGPCGMELCLFINSVVKNGNAEYKRCNEYSCCLDHKDPFYEDKRSRLPKVGDFITTHTGEMGRVERLDLWTEEFEMMTDKGILKRYVSELRNETLNKRTVQFPKTFDNTSNETKTVMGFNENEAARKLLMEAESEQYKISNRDFAEKNFELLFGEKSLDFSLPEIDE